MATRTLWRLAALALALSGSTLLAACGGGGDEVENATPLNATLLIKSDPAAEAAAACAADSAGSCASSAR